MMGHGSQCHPTTHNQRVNNLKIKLLELGLISWRSSFDTWYGGKKQYDYVVFLKRMPLTQKLVRGILWSDYDLRTMVERGHQSSIVMWSITKSVNRWFRQICRERRLLVKTIGDVDATTCHHGSLINHFAMVQEAMKRQPQSLMRLVSIHSEANYESLRAKYPNWLIYGSETSSATRTRGSLPSP